MARASGLRKPVSHLYYRRVGEMKTRCWLMILMCGLFLAGDMIPLAAQVPPEFSDLYPVMETDLTNFEATLDAGWNGTFYTNAQFAAVILPATDGGESVAISNINYLAYTVIPYLNALHQMGIKTVKVSFNFPYLYQPFFDSPVGQNYPAGYMNLLNFASNLVAQVRQRNMKIIIPTQNLFPFLIPAISNYYASLWAHLGCTTNYAANQSSSQCLLCRASINASRWPTPGLVQNCPRRLKRPCFPAQADSTAPLPMGQPRLAISL